MADADVRGALEDERQALQRQLKELGADGGISFDENFADSGQVAAEQGENRALVNQLEETLTEVERALTKLDEGTYGNCEACGKAIAEPRLEAMPATRYCIDCATAR
jgi:DnaK suppressor protein